MNAEKAMDSVVDFLQNSIGSLRLSLSLSQAVTLVLVASGFVYVVKHRLRKRLWLPPGPSGWPLIGSLPLLGNMPHHSLYRLSKQYGPIMYLKLGTTDTVVVSSPKMAEAFLKANDLKFSSRPGNSAAKYIGYDNNSVLWAPYGPAWRMKRKVCNIHLFAAKALEELQPVRQAEVGMLVKSILEHERQGKAVNLGEQLNACAANVLGQILLNKRVFDSRGSKASEFREMVIEQMELAGKFIIGDFVPSLAWVDLQGVRTKMKRLHNRFDEFLNKLIKERETATCNGGKRDFLSVLWALRDDVDGEGGYLTDADIKGLLLTLFTAGTDTSSITVEWSPFRPPNRTWESLISEKIKADANRLRYLKRSMSNYRSSKVDQEEDAIVPVMPGSGEYIINAGFGTPNQSMYTLIDTGSDVAWIPCKQCQGCQSNAAPPFDSTLSSSYKSLDCNSEACMEAGGNCGENSECDVQLQYGDGSVVKGPLSSDTITVGSQSLPNFSFTCAESVSGLDQNQPGLMGLGRGPLSLLNQPTAKLFGGIFSYCLPSRTSSASSGSLVLGKEAALSTSGLQFTTLVKNPSNPTFYYLNLKGISVGNTTVTIPASREGTVLDSGTTLTYLAGPDYMALRDTFRSQIPNKQVESTPNFDTCYQLSSSSANVPIITLHFDRNVDLVLPEENTLVNAGSGLSCFAFSTASDSIPPILGNVQQQNFRIGFDVPNSQVGFAQEHCTAA